MPQGIGLANRLSPHFNIDRQDSNIESGLFFHNGHKSAGKMTLKSSEKIKQDIDLLLYIPTWIFADSCQ